VLSEAPTSVVMADGPGLVPLAEFTPGLGAAFPDPDNEPLPEDDPLPEDEPPDEPDDWLTEPLLLQLLPSPVGVQLVSVSITMLSSSTPAD